MSSTSSLPQVKPYAFIVSFGLVSMFMDIVYQGALAVQGPLLASFGATALIVGIVSGLGEATALAGRLFSGPLADRTGRYWTFAIAGYAATALAVPAMGFVGSLLGVSLLVIFERFGKSLRTPSRDAMLSHAASAVGRGKGFALHEVMDQIGAMGGPLIVAALLSLTGNDYRVALGALVIPGLIAIAVLLMLRHRAPDPRMFEAEAPEAHGEGKPACDTVKSGEASAAAETKDAGGTAPAKNGAKTREPLPRLFWIYSFACGIMLAGVATFGVLSYHMVSTGMLDDAAVPLLYAVAMGVDAIFAALTGVLFDKFGPKTLLVLPVVCAAIPFFSYAGSVPLVIVGVTLWGAALGIQESTMRAAVAGMIPAHKRATAYGMFSVTVGIGGLIGGIVAGGLYDVSIPLLIGYAVVVEAVAFVLLAKALNKAKAESKS